MPPKAKRAKHVKSDNSTTNPNKIGWKHLPPYVCGQILQYLGNSIIDEYHDLIHYYFSDNEDEIAIIRELINRRPNKPPQPLQDYMKVLLVCRAWTDHFTKILTGTNFDDECLSETLLDLQSGLAEQYVTEKDYTRYGGDGVFASLYVTLGPFWHNRFLHQRMEPFDSLICTHHILTRNQRMRLLGHLEPWLKFQSLPLKESPKTVVGIPIQFDHREMLYLNVRERFEANIDSLLKCSIYTIDGFAIPGIMQQTTAYDMADLQVVDVELKVLARELDLVKGIMQSTKRNSKKKPFWLVVGWNRPPPSIYSPMASNWWYCVRYPEKGNAEVYSKPDHWGIGKNQMGLDYEEEDLETEEEEEFC